MWRLAMRNQVTLCRGVRQGWEHRVGVAGLVEPDAPGGKAGKVREDEARLGHANGPMVMRG